MTKQDPATIAGRHPEEEEEGPAPCYVLRVATGPDAGTSHVVDAQEGTRQLVGTSQVCDFVLSDRRVSRRHLAVVPQGRALRITDLESSNGTRIGGVRVFDVLVTGGETIEIGETALRVTRAPGSERRASTRQSFGRLLGTSHAMQQVFEAAGRLAASELSILIEGDTGTGKSLLAESIHDASARAAGPLLHVDASLDPTRLEALLVGDDETGLLARAASGTVVIDEVAELEPAAQSLLLRTLEKGFSARLVSTTKRDLDREVQEGRFREDLYYRLAAARIELPALRERHGDVALLASHFWTLFGGAGELPKAWLLRNLRHPWPGNVRELENAVASEIALASDREPAEPPANVSDEAKRADEAPAAAPSASHDVIARALRESVSLQHARQVVLAELEARFVKKALAEHDNNITRAAAASGLTRRYFHMLLAKSRDDA